MSNIYVVIYLAVAVFILYLPARIGYKLAVLVSIPFMTVMAGIAIADAFEGLFKEHHFGNKWSTFGEEASQALGILIIAGAPLWLALSRWRRVNAVTEPLISPDWRAQRKIGPTVGLGCIALGNFACLSGVLIAAYLLTTAIDLGMIGWYFVAGAQLYFIGIVIVELSIRAWEKTRAT